MLRQLGGRGAGLTNALTAFARVGSPTLRLAGNGSETLKTVRRTCLLKLVHRHLKRLHYVQLYDGNDNVDGSSVDAAKF